jgi:hypothetical protein
MQEEEKTGSPAALVGDEPRVLYGSLRLCERVAPEKEGTASFLRQNDTRQDTPSGVNAEVCFVDTGDEDGSDTRRDHPAEGWWQYVCGVWVMIQDDMDQMRQVI